MQIAVRIFHRLDPPDDGDDYRPRHIVKSEVFGPLQQAGPATLTRVDLHVARAPPVRGAIENAPTSLFPTIKNIKPIAPDDLVQ